MAITGYLAEFSLSEIFRFLEQGRKTGLLTITTEPRPYQPSGGHYIWFRQGQVVAAAHRSDHHGLTNLICQRGWLGDRAALRLAQCCPADKPLGLSLKMRGILDADQLRHLFYIQVMRQVCALFALPDAWFHFDSKAHIPYQELTGLHAPARDVTLAGLRALKDWSALANKLPDTTSALVNVIDGHPPMKLSTSEWQVWEFTDGQTSLQAIASQLGIPLEKLQRIAFRLIVTGIAEELPIWGQDTLPDYPNSVHTASSPSLKAGRKAAASQADLSHNFLQHLVSFLKGET